MNYPYSPIVITGPSGSGKSVLIEYIEQNNPLFIEAYGATTREKRENETGKMYFISHDEFEQLIDKNLLIEYCIYRNNYYGVLKSELEKLRERYVMFNVGYSSAQVIQSMQKSTFMIYLLPPKEELLRRLGDRGYERYLLGIEETVNNAEKFDYLLLSQTDNLKGTYEDFMNIVEQKNDYQKSKMVLARNKDFIKNFYK